MPSRLLRRIRIGVLPPGSYAVPKAGYTLVAMQGEHLADPASQRGIEKFPMALVGRGLRAEVSSSGLSCLVVHTAVNGGGKRRRLLLDEQKSWAVEDIQIWKTVYAAVKKVQAATDRAVHNLEAGRLHVSCSSPPEIIFYANAFDNTPLDLSEVPVTCTRQRLNANADRNACMLSKLVLNTRSGSCSIVCVSESRGSCYKSRRTLRTATFASLTNAYTAEVRDIGKSNSTWTKEEIRCLGKFLDVRKYWQQYWATEPNQGRTL